MQIKKWLHSSVISSRNKNVIGENEFGEVHLGKCTVEIFAGLTNAQLEAFIFARENKYRTKTSLPAKGTLEEAKTNTNPTKRNASKL
jgi:hypothetical protein